MADREKNSQPKGRGKGRGGRRGSGRARGNQPLDPPNYTQPPWPNPFAQWPPSIGPPPIGSLQSNNTVNAPQHNRGDSAAAQDNQKPASQGRPFQQNQNQDNLPAALSRDDNDSPEGNASFNSPWGPLLHPGMHPVAQMPYQMPYLPYGPPYAMPMPMPYGMPQMPPSSAMTFFHQEPPHNEWTLQGQAPPPPLIANTPPAHSRNMRAPPRRSAQSTSKREDNETDQESPKPLGNRPPSSSSNVAAVPPDRSYQRGDAIASNSNESENGKNGRNTTNVQDLLCDDTIDSVPSSPDKTIKDQQNNLDMGVNLSNTSEKQKLKRRPQRNSSAPGSPQEQTVGQGNAPGQAGNSTLQDRGPIVGEATVFRNQHVENVLNSPVVPAQYLKPVSSASCVPDARRGRPMHPLLPSLPSVSRTNCAQDERSVRSMPISQPLNLILPGANDISQQRNGSPIPLSQQSGLLQIVPSAIYCPVNHGPELGRQNCDMQRSYHSGLLQTAPHANGAPRGENDQPMQQSQQSGLHQTAHTTNGGPRGRNDQPMQQSQQSGLHQTAHTTNGGPRGRNDQPMQQSQQSCLHQTAHTTNGGPRGRNDQPVQQSQQSGLHQTAHTTNGGPRGRNDQPMQQSQQSGLHQTAHTTNGGPRGRNDQPMQQSQQSGLHQTAHTTNGGPRGRNDQPVQQSQQSSLHQTAHTTNGDPRGRNDQPMQQSQQSGLHQTAHTTNDGHRGRNDQPMQQSQQSGLHQTAPHANGAPRGGNDQLMQQSSLHQTASAANSDPRERNDQPLQRSGLLQTASAASGAPRGRSEQPMQQSQQSDLLEPFATTSSAQRENDKPLNQYQQSRLLHTESSANCGSKDRSNSSDRELESNRFLSMASVTGTQPSTKPPSDAKEKHLERNHNKPMSLSLQPSSSNTEIHGRIEQNIPPIPPLPQLVPSSQLERGRNSPMPLLQQVNAFEPSGIGTLNSCDIMSSSDDWSRESSPLPERHQARHQGLPMQVPSNGRVKPRKNHPSKVNKSSEVPEEHNSSNDGAKKTICDGDKGKEKHGFQTREPSNYAQELGQLLQGKANQPSEISTDECDADSADTDRVSPKVVEVVIPIVNNEVNGCRKRKQGIPVKVDYSQDTDNNDVPNLISQSGINELYELHNKPKKRTAHRPQSRPSSRDGQIPNFPSGSGSTRGRRESCVGSMTGGSPKKRLQPEKQGSQGNETDSSEESDDPLGRHKYKHVYKKGKKARRGGGQDGNPCG